MFDRAREEAQELGALSGVELGVPPRAEGEQPGRDIPADLETQERIRAHETGGAAEYSLIALDCRARQGILSGAQEGVDGVPASSMRTPALVARGKASSAASTHSVTASTSS